MSSDFDEKVAVEEAGLPRIDIVRNLFREYERSVEPPACFEDFECELDTLPGEYAPPVGGLFLALRDSRAVGCVAIRPQNDLTAEVKRLFVKAPYRRAGIGLCLMMAVISHAKRAGINELMLETLPTMHAAIELYRQLGFVPAPAYHHPTAPGVRLLIKALETRSAQN